MTFRTLLILALALGSVAQAAPTFAYQGRLERNGIAQNGLFHLRFSTYSQPTGGTALRTETFSNVTVTSGTFAVELGSNTPFDEALLTLPALYVEIEVQEPSEPSFHTLVGRQKLLHVPFAPASNGNFTVTGQLKVGSLFPDGGSSITDGGYAEVVNGRLQVNLGATQLAVDSQRIASTGTLQLQQGGGSTVINGPLTLSGATQLNSTLTATGSITTTGAVGANNVWTKIVDFNGTAAPSSTLVTVNGLTGNRMFKIYVNGLISVSNATAFLGLRVAGITAGYRTIASWVGDNTNGETDGNAPTLRLARNGNNRDSQIIGEYLLGNHVSGYTALTGQYTQYDVTGPVYAMTQMGRVASGTFSQLQVVMETGGSFSGQVQIYASP